MINIHKYTRWLQIISIVFGLFLFIEICVKWLINPSWVLSSELLYNLYLRYSFDPNWFSELSSMPFNQKLLGFAVDGLRFGIMLASILSFNQFLKQLKIGVFFTSDIVQSLSTLSKFALCWAVYNPIKTTLLSIITTLHKGPGNRIISAEFGIKDMMNIFIFGCFVLITALMQEGLKLKKEQDLTI